MRMRITKWPHMSACLALSDGNDYPQNADDNAGTTNLLGEPSSSYSLLPFTEMQHVFSGVHVRGTHLGMRWIWHMQK